MATSKSLPHRSIVVVGRKGAGKSTIGNSLSQTSYYPVGCVLSNKKEWVVRTSFYGAEEYFTFYMVDTVPHGNTAPDVPFPENISLVVFVFRHGCFTHEEKDLFENVIRVFNEKLKQILAIVVTGCDNLSDEAKEEYRRNLESDHETRNIAAIAEKGIYCVTLPNKSKLNAKQLELYEEDIQESHEQMKQLVKSCLHTIPLESLLNVPLNGPKDDRLSRGFDWKQCLIL